MIRARIWGREQARSHRDCVLPVLDRNYLPARQEREKQRGQKEKKDFFSFPNLEGIEIFLLDDDDDDDVADVFFFFKTGGGGFEAMLSFFYDFLSERREGRKKRAGRLKISSYQSTYVKR